MVLDEALVRVIDAFERAEVEYALAGGFALAVYCEPRATYDMDLVVLSSIGAAEHALREQFGSVYRNLEVMPYRLVRVHRFLLIEDDKEFVLDLLEPCSLEFAEIARESRRSIAFHERRLSVIGPEVLWLLKKASSRPQDEVDAAMLEERLDASLRTSLAEQWLV